MNLENDLFGWLTGENVGILMYTGENVGILMESTEKEERHIQDALNFLKEKLK